MQDFYPNFKDFQAVLHTLPSCLDISQASLFPLLQALQALSNSGDWKEGIRFSQSASTEELDGWAESLK